MGKPKSSQQKPADELLTSDTAIHSLIHKRKLQQEALLKIMTSIAAKESESANPIGAPKTGKRKRIKH